MVNAGKGNTMLILANAFALLPYAAVRNAAKDAA